MTNAIVFDLREPTADDLAFAADVALARQSDPVRALAVISARLAGVPLASIMSLPQASFRAVIDRAGKLVTAGQDRQHAEAIAARKAAAARAKAEKKSAKAAEREARQARGVT